jgi:adenylylsulfate kinase
MTTSKNVVWHNAVITRQLRQQQNKHKSLVLWFTGLSGSGKSTLAHAVEEKLYEKNYRTMVLDGDNVRHGLCGDLGFSNEDRIENIRRIGELSKLFVEAGMIVLNAFISPFKMDRQQVRRILPHGDFIEIFCDCSIDVCESRDVKGLYKKARNGEISHFTGISSPYEPPDKPELCVNTAKLSIEESVDVVLQMLESRC